MEQDGIASGGTPPSEGERRAIRGYQHQYQAAAQLIYQALGDGSLTWIGLADPNAGILDDLLLGQSDGMVVGHQFKSSLYPAGFSARTRLLGSEALLDELIASWRLLKAQQGAFVRVRYITTDFPFPTDRLCDGGGSSAAFLSDLPQAGAARSLAYWRTTRWAAFVEELFASSNLNERDFDNFMNSIEFRTGIVARPLDQLSPAATDVRQTRELASVLQRLVASSNGRSRWSTDELLRELNRVAPFAARRSHQFPVGQPFQPNETTHERLQRAITVADQGYVALLGVPGAGKSTLLQSALNSGAGMIVVRYYAYMPGETQGLGRAEADAFLEDINVQLRATGLSGHPKRNWDETRAERRERLEILLRQAGKRFRDHGVRTVITVDGLDHIAREERPDRPLLAELPLPDSLPPGVVVVLGSQHLDLQDLPPSIQVEAARPGRCVSVDPLSREAVYRLAKQVGLPQHIHRDRLYHVSQGHPLATRYLLEALKNAETHQEQAELLEGTFTFEGDLNRVYTSAWTALSRDERAVEILGYVARAEGYIDPRVIATILPEGAVEHAYQTTRHLLTRDSAGRWRIFHNSFRLFVLGQRRERFGIPDPDYDRRIYRGLAGLAGTAPSTDPQHWLELRYATLAQDYPQVRALATPDRLRAQLAAGRSAREITADVRLALRAAETRTDMPFMVKLVMTLSEIGRRQSALAEGGKRVDAYLALGDLDAARAAAEDGPVNGSFRVVLGTPAVHVGLVSCLAHLLCM